MTNIDDKISILMLILKHKEILFAKFCSTTPQETRIETWKEIAEQTRALGIYSKDWKYLRDTTWQNWRKRTIEKRDNLHTTDVGRRKLQYDEADQMILQIIGSEPQTIAESSSTDNSIAQSTSALNIDSNQSEEEIKFSSQIKTSSTSYRKSEVLPQQSKVSSCFKRKRIFKQVSNDIIKLKKEKLLKQNALAAEKMEIAKRERHKLDLELFKLEKELQLPPSVFTKKFHESSRSISVSDSASNPLKREERKTTVDSWH